MKIYVYNIECGTCITTNKLTNNKVCEQIKVKDISAFKQSEIHISSYLYLAKSYVKPQYVQHRPTYTHL